MRSFVIRVFLVGFALGMGIGENANTCESVVGRRRVLANRSIYGAGRLGLLAQDTVVGGFVPEGESCPAHSAPISAHADRPLHGCPTEA
jgi:hypothetical protein